MTDTVTDQAVSDKAIIDRAGYRCGVGIILINHQRRVFFAKRIGIEAWQFPQGGLKEKETTEQAMFRELKEEVGLNPEDVEILASTKHWLRYRLPKRLVRHHHKPLCIGQKQKWFLLRLVSKDEAINLAAHGHPEFDAWRWVSYWYPLHHVVPFKRRVYILAMKTFSKVAILKKPTLQKPLAEAPSHPPHV